MGRLLPMVKARFLDENGDPLSGGKLYSYIAGTTTPLGTFSDDEVTPNTNPVILDSDGYADIWLASASIYKFKLDDANDVTQWTVDNIPGTSGGVSSSSGGWSAWTEHSITDGQSSTELDGETVDITDYSSCVYEYEIIRGTTVVANGRFSIQLINGSARLVDGGYMAGEDHGCTFAILKVGDIVTLYILCDSGAGDGTVKLTRKLTPI